MDDVQSKITPPTLVLPSRISIGPRRKRRRSRSSLIIGNRLERDCIWRPRLTNSHRLTWFAGGDGWGVVLKWIKVFFKGIDGRCGAAAQKPTEDNGAITTVRMRTIKHNRRYTTYNGSKTQMAANQRRVGESLCVQEKLSHLFNRVNISATWWNERVVHDWRGQE